MIIYNITINVDWSIHQQWLDWMIEEQIPGMLATGFFSDHRMVKLLQVDESDGPTYAVQYYTASLDEYNLFIEREAAVQQQKEYKRWGDKIVAFSTIMEVVH